MKTHLDPETDNQFAGANRGNGGGVQRAGKALNCPAPSRGKPSKSLRYLRFFLFNSHSHTVLALAAMLAAAAALLPAAAYAQAIEAWVQRYNGPGNGSDGANAVAVDASGNVVVTGSAYNGIGHGSDYTTIKYSSAGVPLWTNRYNGTGNDWDNALAVGMDASGNAFVTGHSSSDWATIKYSSAGIPLWTNRYNGPGNDLDIAKSLAVDASGNVVVTGYSAGSGTGYDYTTIKYSGAGELLWIQRYNGPGNREDLAYAVAMDATGNVYVTGAAWSTSESGFATIAYSSAGVPLWTNQYSSGEARGVVVDASGNVVVTGCSSSGGTAYDYATIKYSSAGVPLWTNRYNGPGNSEDWAYAVGVDAAGNVYVTGTSTGTGGRADYATIAYSSAGVPLWTNRYDGPANNDDGGKAVAVDASGNVYVTGESWGIGTSDYATVAYSSAGVPLWTNRYDSPANNDDRGQAVAVDASGNVYVTGRSTGSGSGYDFATVKYVPPAVIITRQPLSRTNAVGTIATFTVEVAGSAPFGYQWRRQETNLVNGVTVSGATTTNLLIANVQPTAAAGYTVVVTNNYGSVTSHVAQLTVVSLGRFSNLSYSPATGLSFIFRDATVGQPYRIQRSPSMAEGSWTNWQSFTYTEPTGFMDVGATGAERRFYRAISP